MGICSATTELGAAERRENSFQALFHLFQSPQTSLFNDLLIAVSKVQNICTMLEDEGEGGGETRDDDGNRGLLPRPPSFT